uniref:Membrane frizzled-related protein n=1 Tax=Fundulus heteroclitus TaxID=8078 RepID=A0A3Q2QV86_FUNHE
MICHPGPSQGFLEGCWMRLRGSGDGWGPVVVSAAVLLLLIAVGLALALLLTRESLLRRGRSGRDRRHLGLNECTHCTVGRIQIYALSNDVLFFFSSPNHPGSYPPNSHCVWVIQVPPPHLVQIRVSSLAVEGPSPCLFDWLEVQEQVEQTSVVTRFCGAVPPPTINTNSSTAWVTFHSDNSIAGSGFAAQYRAVLPAHRSCSREEFMCDGVRCLLPVSVCDGYPNCLDQRDENVVARDLDYQTHAPSLCVWHISVDEGHVVSLSFRNFSLETQDVCEFDYVEVHDSSSLRRLLCLGDRFCGTALPPDLTSTGPRMTVVFVADEGVADSGFNATYQAVSVLNITCGPGEFACSTGECLQQQWLCDGWSDCPDGADEQASSCEVIEVEMCQGLSYNLTSFPNIWLSIADQREAATRLRQYRVLMELACFEPLRRLVCGMVVPQCSPQGGVLQPCRSACSSAEQQCSPALGLLSFSWPFNCHLLPDSRDPVECSQP